MRAIARSALVVLLCLLSTAAFCQASPSSSPSAAPEAPAASEGSGDLESGFFGEGDIVAPESKTGKVQETYTEDLLKTEPLRIGGDFELKVQAATGWKKDISDWNWDYLRKEGTEDSSLILKSSLFFTARPNAHLRYYGKAKVAYPFSSQAASSSDLTALTDSSPATVPGTGIPVPSISIWELFTDVDVGDKVFIRAGKQMVKWGVGYFFQPADIISLSSIDIYDPTQEREGPIAVKANLPFGKNNLDLYAIAPSGDTITSIKQIGLASRAQFVVGGYELGAGVAYQQTKDWQFVGTLSGSVGKFALFGEGLVKRKSLGNHIESAAEILTDRDTWFFDGTAGATYVNGDAYLTITGQYYFNGEGYEDAKKIGDAAAADLQSGAVSLTDIMGNTGMHYLGANLSWTIKENSKLGLGAMWIGNLSDGSGTTRPQATIDLTDQIQLCLFTTINYGQDKSQFRGISALSALNDGFVISRASIGATLSIGTGNF